MNKVETVEIIYARPNGTHYHTDRNCMMLTGNQYATLGYKEIIMEEVYNRRLIPCMCTRAKK